MGEAGGRGSGRTVLSSMTLANAMILGGRLPARSASEAGYSAAFLAAGEATGERG